MYYIQYTADGNGNIKMEAVDQKLMSVDEYTEEPIVEVEVIVVVEDDEYAMEGNYTYDDDDYMYDYSEGDYTYDYSEGDYTYDYSEGDYYYDDYSEGDYNYTDEENWEDYEDYDYEMPESYFAGPSSLDI